MHDLQLCDSAAGLPQSDGNQLDENSSHNTSIGHHVQILELCFAHLQSAVKACCWA